MTDAIVSHDRLDAAVSRFGISAVPALSFDYEHEHRDAEHEQDLTLSREWLR